MPGAPKVRPGSLNRYGNKRIKREQYLEGYLTPPWDAWKPHPRLSTRVARWVEEYCLVPTGHNAVRPLKLAPYQRTILRRAYDADNSMLVVSMPAANAKTTTLAAMALERMTRGDPFV